MPLFVSSEFQNIFDVVTTRAAAHPQALLNDVLYNASLSSSEGTVRKNLW